MEFQSLHSTDVIKCCSVPRPHPDSPTKQGSQFLFLFTNKNIHQVCLFKWLKKKKKKSLTLNNEKKSLVKKSLQLHKSNKWILIFT